MYQSHPLDARLAEALAPGSLFAVGGRVRDELRADARRASTCRPRISTTSLPASALEELTARLADARDGSIWLAPPLRSPS